MSYGVITTVVGSVADYDRIHELAVKRTGGVLGGLLLHVGRETENGYQVIEVWDTKEQAEACNREIIWPLITEIAAELASAEPAVKEFAPRGLILSGKQIAR